SSTTSLNVSGGPLTTVSTNSIVVGANVQLSGAQGIRMGTPMLNLGAGSSLASSLASGTAVSIGSQFPGGLTINLPDSGSVTMSTGGGSLFLGPALLEFPIGSPPGTAPTPVSNLPLVFAKGAGPGATTLSISGGQVLTQTTNATTTVSAGVTISSSSPIIMKVNSSTLLNDGTIASTAPGTSNPALNIQSSGNLTVTGTGALAGTLIQANSTSGSVILSQGAVTGKLGGSSATGFSAMVATGGLQVGDIAVSNGSVAL